MTQQSHAVTPFLQHATFLLKYFGLYPVTQAKTNVVPAQQPQPNIQRQTGRRYIALASGSSHAQKEMFCLKISLVEQF